LVEGRQLERNRRDGFLRQLRGAKGTGLMPLMRLGSRILVAG
jgi:hypothetical protein